MVVHAEHGLMVFVDASPSEQLNFKSDNKICIVGVVCDDDEGMPGLYDFKTGSWKIKIGRARTLRAAISDESILLHAFGVTGRTQSLATWACDAINQAREPISGAWSSDAKSFTWGGTNFPRSQALGVAAFASALNLLGVRAGDWLKRMEVKRATFLLDRLPGQSSEAMGLMEAISKHSALAQNWTGILKKYGVSFCITNLGSYVGSRGIEKPGKCHPNAILADWLAASLRAKHDPQSFVGKNGKPHKPEDVEQIAAVWDALAAKTRAIEIDMDDPKLIKELEKRTMTSISRGADVSQSQGR